MTAEGARVTSGRLHGWDTVVLANDLIEVTVLPAKGADIYSLVDRRSGVDVLFKAPWGLQPPGGPVREGSGNDRFLHNYEGGWQELLPNTNDPCTVDGIPHPFHGDVATLPWSFEVRDAGPQPGGGEAAEIAFTVDCVSLPLRLERVMACTPGRAEIVLTERIRNLSGDPVRFTWGHHLVLGAPLVAAGAIFTIPGRTIRTPDPPWEDTARLVPGQQSNWPLAQLRGGGEANLSEIPGPERNSHDDVYFTDLDAGWAQVWNPSLNLGFRLEFDPTIFRWLISWQPFGGAHTLPLAGSYGLGIEPWTAGGNLEHAVETGQALTLDGLGSQSTRLTAALLTADPDPGNRSTEETRL
jgi:hypothetical protein